MDYKDDLKEYTEELINDSIFQVLMYGEEFPDALENYAVWLEAHSNEKSSSWLCFLISKTMEECVTGIGCADDARKLKAFAEDVWAAYKALPPGYKDILEELCVQKLTWRTLRMIKYHSNHTIGVVRQKSLDALRKMVTQ